MKASELRIGNLIGFNYGNRKTYSTITEITSIDVKLNDGFAELSQLKPIPLTEKWLLRFGFESEGEGGSAYLKLNNLVHLCCFVDFESNLDYVKFYMLELMGDINEHDETCGIPIKMQYVHQLQNLYFALTGEELKPKDDENN